MGRSPIEERMFAAAHGPVNRAAVRRVGQALPASSDPFSVPLLDRLDRESAAGDNAVMVRISLDELGRDALKYLRQVEGGETVVVMRAEQPVAEIRPVQQRAQALRPAGLCAGEFVVPDDFDAPLPDDVLDSFVT